MNKSLSDMSLEQLWELFPIFLVEHDGSWNDWFAQEREILAELLGDTARVSHVGSTAIPSIWAKPIIDILVELPDDSDMAFVRDTLVNAGYICMNEDGDRVSLNKGYTEQGFADKVFHLHLRRAGDNDELYFRDYLIDHPGVADEYESLKLRLWHEFEHDRDAYTDAKSKFVSNWTKVARQTYGDRY